MDMCPLLHLATCSVCRSTCLPECKTCSRDVSTGVCFEMVGQAGRESNGSAVLRTNIVRKDGGGDSAATFEARNLQLADVRLSSRWTEDMLALSALARDETVVGPV